jgi:hypothetical protein
MIPAAAQNVTDLMQQGIFAQETEGNLDRAIAIYRQVVNSAPAQRDLAAQAQYRLAQALLQKGDLSLASTEFNTLARDYADYQKLVSRLATQAGRAAPMTSANTPLTAMTYDPTRPVNVRGKVTQLTYINPVSLMGVAGDNGEAFLLVLGSATGLSEQGIQRDTFKPGDEVTVTGAVANTNEKVQGRTLAGAATITTADGRAIFRRVLPEGSADLKAETRALGDLNNSLGTAQLGRELMDAYKRADEARDGLNILRQHFKEEHPDVQMMKKKYAESVEAVERLRKKIEEEKKR